MSVIAELAAAHGGSFLAIPEAELRRSPAVRADKARENVGTAALLLVRVATEEFSAERTADELRRAINFLQRAERTIRSRGRR